MLKVFSNYIGFRLKMELFHTFNPSGVVTSSMQILHIFDIALSSIPKGSDNSDRHYHRYAAFTRLCCE